MPVPLWPQTTLYVASNIFFFFFFKLKIHSNVPNFSLVFFSWIFKLGHFFFKVEIFKLNAFNQLQWQCEGEKRVSLRPEGVNGHWSVDRSRDAHPAAPFQRAIVMKALGFFFFSRDAEFFFINFCFSGSRQKKKNETFQQRPSRWSHLVMEGGC